MDVNQVSIVDIEGGNEDVINKILQKGVPSGPGNRTIFLLENGGSKIVTGEEFNPDGPQGKQFSVGLRSGDNYAIFVKRDERFTIYVNQTDIDMKVYTFVAVYHREEGNYFIDMIDGQQITLIVPYGRTITVNVLPLESQPPGQAQQQNLQIRSAEFKHIDVLPNMKYVIQGTSLTETNQVVPGQIRLSLNAQVGNFYSEILSHLDSISLVMEHSYMFTLKAGEELLISGKNEYALCINVELKRHYALYASESDRFVFKAYAQSDEIKGVSYIHVFCAEGEGISPFMYPPGMFLTFILHKNGQKLVVYREEDEGNQEQLVTENISIHPGFITLLPINTGTLYTLEFKVPEEGDLASPGYIQLSAPYAEEIEHPGVE